MNLCSLCLDPIRDETFITMFNASMNPLKPMIQIQNSPLPYASTSLDFILPRPLDSPMLFC